MRTALAWLMTGFVLVSFAQAADEGHKVKTKKHGITAVFPEKPKQTDLKDGEQYILEVKETGAYLLQYNSFEKEIDTDDKAVVKKIFDAAMEAMIKALPGAKLASSKDSVQDEMPIRDFELDMGEKGSYIGRLVLDDDKMIQVAVLGTKAFVKTDEAKEFLASVEVDDE